MVDTILIDDHNVRALTGARVVGQIEGIYAPSEFRGEPKAIPGRDGRIGVELPYADYIITIPLWIAGATRGERNARLRALGPLLTGSRGLVTVKRTIDTVTTPDTHSAPGQYITGLSPKNLNHRTSMVNLQYYQLKGRWSDDDGATWTLL